MTEYINFKVFRVQGGFRYPDVHYLWLAKLSSPSVHRVPAVANIMVVSRSAMIPLTALAALIQAWVPRDPDWSAARTKATFSLTLRACSWRSRRAYLSWGSPWTLPASCTSSTQLLPRSWTVVRIRFAIYRERILLSCILYNTDMIGDIQADNTNIIMFDECDWKSTSATLLFCLQSKLLDTLFNRLQSQSPETMTM